MGKSPLSDICAERKGRGGYRPGAGRPKGPQAAEDIAARREAARIRQRQNQRPHAPKPSEAQPPRIVECTCSVCGVSFEYIKSGSGKFRRFCTAECKRKAMLKSAADSKARIALGIRKNNYPEVVAPSKRYDLRCEVCHSPYRGAKGPRGNRFCSSSCLNEHHCRLRKEARDAALSKRECSFCGVEYLPTGGRSRFCSASCRDKLSNLNKNYRRRSKLGTGSVNPYVIFARDGWVCQICKEETPRALRGTTDPRAPELDHIMPLSLGGLHSAENTQCLCRACNGSKGAKLTKDA